MPRIDPLLDCTGFDWDSANVRKNWDRHRVTAEEAEDAFFHEPLIVKADVEHTTTERRYHALGRTERGRLLFVAFTIRRGLIRVISARDMNRKEARIYRDESKKKDSTLQ